MKQTRPWGCCDVLANIPADNAPAQGDAVLDGSEVAVVRKTRLSLWVIAVTLLTTGVMLLSCAISHEQQTAVRTARVTLGRVEQTVVLRGHVGYEAEYAAIAPVTGVVAQVYVSPGDAVTAGQALFRMDDAAEVAAISSAWAAGEKFAAYTGAAEAAAQARLHLESLTVRARADGLVQQVSVKPLDGTAAGMPGMILSGAGQEIRCAAVVRDAAQVSPGMTARLIFAGVTACMGTVTSVGPAQTDATTGQVLCQVTIVPEKPLDLPMGAAVEAEIIRAAAEAVTVLPVTALTANNTVWWLAEGRVWETPVTVVLQDGMYCWVSLPEGTCVVDAPSGLVHGQLVEVTP